MTHMLPRALRAIQPIVERKFPDMPREGYYPKYEHGDLMVEITLSEEEKKEFWKAYSDQPNPLEGKTVIHVIIK